MTGVIDLLISVRSSNISLQQIEVQATAIKMLVQAWYYQDMHAYSQKLLNYFSTSVKGKQVSNYIAHMYFPQLMHLGKLNMLDDTTVYNYVNLTLLINC